MLCWKRNNRFETARPALGTLAWTSSSMSVPVTRFSMRMYGSRKAVEKEQQRQEDTSKWVIHPYSNVRFYWDLVSLVLLIVSMLTIPIAITFFNEEMTSHWPWIAFNLCLDCWFLLDILLNFHTGIIMDTGEGDVILDLDTIRVKYFKSWFVVDLISTLPIDYILQIVGMQYDLAVSAVRIFNLVCLMLLIGHWNGCLQFLVPMLYGFPDDSWIILDQLKDKNWFDQYSWSVFKAMSHMLCIGYGQTAPKNLMDLWMTMLSMVSGAVCFAMFIGHATALIQSMDSSKRQYKEKYMQVKEYMRYRRLPKILRNRVYKYYENRFQGKMFNEQGILDELSTNLREDVVNYNCRHLVASVPFFKEAEPDFVTEVVQKLKFEVFQPEDMIIKEGTYGKKMYFIQHGVVEVRNLERKKLIVTLSDGSFFGEICLLIHERRVASVVTKGYCQIYSLHVDDFNAILEQYPMMRRTLEEVASERLHGIGKQNEQLKKKLGKTDNSSSGAKNLAARIVKHDETQERSTPRNRWNLRQRNTLMDFDRPLIKQRKSLTSFVRSTSYQSQSTTNVSETASTDADKDHDGDPPPSGVSANNGISSQHHCSPASNGRLCSDSKKKKRLSRPKLLQIGLTKKFSRRWNDSLPQRPQLSKRSMSSPDGQFMNLAAFNNNDTTCGSATPDLNRITYAQSDHEKGTDALLPLSEEKKTLCDINNETVDACNNTEYIMMNPISENGDFEDVKEASEEAVPSPSNKSSSPPLSHRDPRNDFVMTNLV